MENIEKDLEDIVFMVCIVLISILWVTLGH